MKINRNDPCWCGSGKKYKQCHEAFDKKVASFARDGWVVPHHSVLKNADDIQKIKDSAKINMACLDEVGKCIKPGMATIEIDEIVCRVTKEMGGICAPLNYEGFPKSVCTSVNDQVCHGIPSEDVILKEGDIINVDCSTIYNDYFSDSSRMFCIGEVSKEARELVERTKEACDIGLREVVPWAPLGNVGCAVKEFAHECGYTVVREIGGHGVGFEFHEDPWVSFVSNRDEGMIMTPGLVFTIEPMINAGSHRIKTDPINGWEVSTIDGSLSAQWEYQVVVTEDGYEVLSW